MADTATTTRKCCRSLGVFCVLTKRLHRPEEQFPDKPIPGNWQVIYHGSNFMSYDPDPSHYVNGSFIVWNLVDIVAKGGLFQIGYGPDRDGEFHPLAVAALHEAGDWLKVNGEAICASAAPSLSCVLPVLALRARVRVADNTRPMPLHWNDTESDFVRYSTRVILSRYVCCPSR